MKLDNYYFFFFLTGIFLVSLNSCKVNDVQDYSPSIKVPAAFTVSDDSAQSIGMYPREQFFTDSLLKNLIDTALKNNPDLQVALQRMELIRSSVLLRKGLMLPTVNGVGSAGVRKFGDYTIDGVGNFDTNLSDNLRDNQHIPNPTPDYFAGFQSSWEVDLWGKLKNRKKAAYTRFLASEKGKHLVETALVAEVASLYYELVALDNKLRILQKNIALQETALEIIRIQKTAGRVTELAVEQFTAQLLGTKSKEAEIQQEIIEAENLMNTLLGRFPQPVPRGKGILDQQLPVDRNVGIPSAMLLKRPDIQQAELELEATKADIEAARAAFLPSLTINAHLGVQAFRAAVLADPGSIAYGILGGLSAPLVNRKYLKADLARSVSQNKIAYYNYKKSILTGFSEVTGSLKALENYDKVYLLKEQQADVLHEAVTTSNDLFLAGFASYLEVITAQKAVLEAELGLINARTRQFVTVIELYRALGGGWQ